MFCKPCETIMCFHCKEHQKHTKQDINTAYKQKRKQNRDLMVRLKSKTLYEARILQGHVNNDFRNCQKHVDQVKFAMKKEAQKVKDLLDSSLVEVRSVCNYLLNSKLNEQRKKMKLYILTIQLFEHVYEKSSNKPVEFFKLIKDSPFPEKEYTPKLARQYMLTLLKQIDIAQLLEIFNKIKFANKGERRVNNWSLLKKMEAPVLQRMVKLELCGCDHISCLTHTYVWVKEEHILILTDTSTGTFLHFLNDALNEGWCKGVHTVNSDGDLFYLNSDYDVIKFSENRNKKTTFVKKTKSIWLPQCIYCSLKTGDVLIGLCSTITEPETDMCIDYGQVTRYNKHGKLIQKIPKSCHNDLFSLPIDLCENNNGDVVVSDFNLSAVVVTDRFGNHRFSYEGIPFDISKEDNDVNTKTRIKYSGPMSGSDLMPWGICTDSLSHILVCDIITNSVHMLDKDGHFLLHLWTKQSPGISNPRNLSYDFKNELVWVSSFDNNTVSAFTYINREIFEPNEIEHMKEHMEDGHES
ncbi:uncharacterized protein LOC111109868 [Crassostrea virginica]